VAVHPAAVVDPAARLGKNVDIGPFAVVGPDVSLGDEVIVGPGCVIRGRTVIGEGTRLHPGVVVGEPPQDLSHEGEPTEVFVGARTILREHVTINCGTVKGRGRTVVGDDCFLMVGAHVGHDCIVGNGVVLSNNVLLAGHATVEDFVLIGGGAAIVQFVRIGAYAFVSGLSGVTKDVVPYAYVIGHRGRIDSLNLVGLKRRGFERAAIRRLLGAYAILFEEDRLLRDRLARLEEEMGADPLVRRILDFVAAGGNRPLLHPLPGRHAGAADDVDILESGR
jgi:UDP-N-acetylglucosamine acyltransferase